ncbi:MAG: FkbM family methyltransferase [Burkholderiales bacterium]
MLKRLAAQLPLSWQHALRRVYFHQQIRRRRFVTDEREYTLLDSFLRSGDWVLDIGANVGHYTMRMSELVGRTGRVIALEPVPDTFALLAANARLFTHANVTLLNVAASDRLAAVNIEIPQFSEGLANYYQARLTSDLAGLAVLTLPVDALALPKAVRLVKIDVEGHELAVLRGMRSLLERDHPVLIVETGAQDAVDLLIGLGYATERLSGSSNLLCRQRESV